MATASAKWLRKFLCASLTWYCTACDCLVEANANQWADPELRTVARTQRIDTQTHTQTPCQVNWIRVHIDKRGAVWRCLPCVAIVLRTAATSNSQIIALSCVCKCVRYQVYTTGDISGSKTPIVIFHGATCKFIAIYRTFSLRARACMRERV